ncbi:MAG: hypothetical protein B9S33_01320 [Pedosphaera sp. Tous-C6FEB]|nr:MAG: hypothetical protein B9S33_01320 [Pedosphaera sp. Tous-C6FEB]
MESLNATLRRLFAGLLFAALAAGLAAADEVEALTPFLKRHCFECHGAEKQKGDVRLDALKPGDIATWQNVLDQLRAGEMPPPKQPQPDVAEKARVITLLNTKLTEAYAQQSAVTAKPVIRRLNRIEFRNSLRDLLYLEQPLFRNLGVPKPEDANGDGSVSRRSDDPIREFPPDELEDGFDNVGSRLVMSDFLLKLIIGAAEECLTHATVPGEMPKVETRRFAGHIRTDGPAGVEGLSRQFNKDYDVLMEPYREPGGASNVGRIAPSKIAGTGVGVSGKYRITVEASAHNQRHPWGELIRSPQDEPKLLSLHLIDSGRGAFNEGNPNTEMLKQWTLPDDGQKHAYSVETWIDAKWLPWLGWENAPHERSLSAEKLVEKFFPADYRPEPKGNVPEKEKRQYRDDMARALFTAGYAGPHIRIHSLTIEPIFDTWPPRSHTFLYGKKGQEPLPLMIQSFAHRAWRRPVKADETARYVALAEERQKGGASREEALRVAYTAMLASPNFYYLRGTESAAQFNYASRLSYFLWSSMPDEELLSLASAGKLADANTRHVQIERMLNHRNAASFVRRFTERWLRLDKLGSMPPPGGFYFHRQMEGQMLKQTDAYFGDLVRRNGPVRDIIESDYTFLNERTAKWIYKRDDVWGDAFRKVPAKPPHGGGMLTMPAAMTATANGVDTSPIVRGVWMLESVLGTPPKPPPPNIEPLSPDLRGARTIREQLEAHRSQESCMGCHRKIDPFGFAFENFDELGLWRTHYKDGGKALKIDPSSTLTDGRTVKDVAEMKRLLLEKEEQVARNLVEKMLIYASGRLLTPRDRGEVERIVGELTKNQYRVRDIIHHVAGSRILLNL